MGAYSVERSEHLTIIRFTASSEVGAASWPAAIVVWSGAVPPRESGWRAAWRAFRYRRGIDPLHATVTIGRDYGLWMGTAGPEGQRETLFHLRRHVVRVLDREFPIRDPGETLVLLINDNDPDGRPRILTRIIEGELQELEEGVAISHKFSVNAFEDPTDPLTMLLRQDPEVRAFLAAGG